MTDSYPLPAFLPARCRPTAGSATPPTQLPDSAGRASHSPPGDLGLAACRRYHRLRPGRPRAPVSSRRTCHVAPHRSAAHGRRLEHSCCYWGDFPAPLRVRTDQDHRAEHLMSALIAARPFSGLAYRGDGTDRPTAVPRCPSTGPVSLGGRLRKYWRYVGVWGPTISVCAARVRSRIADAGVLGGLGAGQRHAEATDPFVRRSRAHRPGPGRRTRQGCGGRSRTPRR